MTDNNQSKLKGNKRSRTRVKLLEAARELVREKGYEATKLDDIARRAGMTTGAIYGNFENREALFIALSKEYWKPIVPNVGENPGFADVLASIADELIAAIPEREAAAVGYLTGRAYALSNQKVLEDARAEMKSGYELGAEWLADTVAEDELPTDAASTVRVIHALTEGLMLQRILAPDLVTDEVVRTAFRLLSQQTPRPSTQK